MSSQKIGSVKARRSGKRFEVKWNPQDRCVYVSYAGWSLAGKASSSSQAMTVAEAWLYDK